MRIASVVCVLLMFGCGAERREHRVAQRTMPAEPSSEIFAIGSELTPQGAVTAESSNDSFRRGPELFLSIDVSSASTDQTIAVHWTDDQGVIKRIDRRVVTRDERYAPFSSGPTHRWRAGKHRAVIVIDGRRVSEKEFGLI